MARSELRIQPERRDSFEHKHQQAAWKPPIESGDCRRRHQQQYPIADKMNNSRALGRLFPPINAPLPLSTRESQRLLDVIKKSFRAELDKQHNYGHGVIVSASKSSKSSSASPIASVSSMPAPVIKHMPELFEPLGPPTDRHVRAILNNPLFGVKDTLKAMPDIGDPYARERLVFEHAVSKGLMNISRAHGFLLKMYKLVSQRAASSVDEAGLGSTGAGLLVLRWLRASNQEFLYDSAFSTILLRFVIAEGYEDLVWTWIEQRIKGNREGLSELVGAFIAAKTYIFELNPAFAAFNKVVAMLEQNSIGKEHLKQGMNRLNWASTVQAVQHAKPSVDLFESFVELSRVSPSLTASRVHLDLHHPTNPSSDLALRYFENNKIWDKVIPEQIKGRPKLQRIMALGLDTAQHLMHTDRTKMGMHILSLLGAHLGTADYLPRSAA
ncbi:hypothetical protein QBC43DRAFT_306902 [Cladorrhinum sp. PSN259]|nr:hypothetical protein QBC43DRAFT_306902 [Cladorrhinum sp. PSN259]